VEETLNAYNILVVKLRDKDTVREAHTWKGVNGKTNFDVLLTVHLSIILVINQLNAQNLVL